MAERCKGWFERKPKGLRYVTARWQCKRNALKGYFYCGYCLPPEDREKRRLALEAKANRSSTGTNR